MAVPRWAAPGAARARRNWVAVAIDPVDLLAELAVLLVSALTLSALLLVASSALALTTFKRGAGGIRTALAALANDLSTPVPRPPVRELSEIADGIATLARRLAEARAIQERARPRPGAKGAAGRAGPSGRQRGAWSCAIRWRRSSCASTWRWQATRRSPMGARRCRPRWCSAHRACVCRDHAARPAGRGSADRVGARARPAAPSHRCRRATARFAASRR